MIFQMGWVWMILLMCSKYRKHSQKSRNKRLHSWHRRLRFLPCLYNIYTLCWLACHLEFKPVDAPDWGRSHPSAVTHLYVHLTERPGFKQQQPFERFLKMHFGGDGVPISCHDLIRTVLQNGLYCSLNQGYKSGSLKKSKQKYTHFSWKSESCEAFPKEENNLS